MDIAYIRAAVEDQFYTKGKNITERFLHDLSPKLFNMCVRRSEKSGLPRNAELYKILYGCSNCYCGKPTKYKNFRDGFTDYCGRKCAGNDPIVDERRKATNLKRYGAARPQQHLPEIREKFKATMVERYGVEYGGQSEELNKRRDQTCVARYGTKNWQGLPRVQAKRRATTKERHGVENIMQRRDVFERQQKSGFKTREVLVGNKTFRVRGFEPEAIDWLVNTKKCKPSEILHTKDEGVPSVQWTKKGKQSYYHPDLKVKIKGKWYIVEVKSTYTLGIQSRSSGGRSGKYTEIQKKAAACVNQGHRFILLLIERKKNGNYYVAQVDNIHEKTKATVRRELKLLHPQKFGQL